MAEARTQDKVVVWGDYGSYDVVPAAPDDYTRRVDLKFSLWSKDKEWWEEYAPGLWDWMRAWYEGNPDLRDQQRVVQTAPKKEIRYGTVSFVPMAAHVNFRTEFDDGTSFTVERTIGEEDAETFEELMAKIDACEEELIEAENA